MKKVLITTIALFTMVLFVGSSVSAQGMPMSKGFKVGLSMAKVTGDDASMEADGMTLDPDYRMGFAFGGFLGFNVSPMFTVQPEIMYVMKGAKYEYEGDKLTWKFDYLEIPVALKYNFATNGNVKPNLYAGPVLSILMSAKEKFEAEGMDGEEDIKDYLKSTDFGIFFGGGVTLQQGSTNIIFDVRYTLGMSDVPDTDEGEDVSIKNSTLNFLVGVGF